MTENETRPDQPSVPTDGKRKQSGGKPPAGPLGSLTDPLKVISAAIHEVPAVRFALGLAGIAAAAAVVSTFVGSGPAAIVTMVAMLVGMLVLYLISVITTGGEVKTLPLPAAVILWAVTLFICAMLSFLTTALAFGWPDHFAKMIYLERSIYAGLTGDAGTKIPSPPAPAPQPKPNPKFETRVVEGKAILQATSTGQETGRKSECLRPTEDDAQLVEGSGGVAEVATNANSIHYGIHAPGTGLEGDPAPRSNAGWWVTEDSPKLICIEIFARTSSAGNTVYYHARPVAKERFPVK